MPHRVKVYRGITLRSSELTIRTQRNEYLPLVVVEDLKENKKSWGLLCQMHQGDKYEVNLIQWDANGHATALPFKNGNGKNFKKTLDYETLAVFPELPDVDALEFAVNSKAVPDGQGACFTQRWLEGDPDSEVKT
mmetsp:Transcript_26692/g.66927  ORF Transcript_26692/g.66927 Transcript_26692/m.66927 type:complete len:135 (+) Transcript_26692:302-706(+)|eukprot:CAMPEP_0174903650 /NCGR_PEP_ID=MMETSP0167-20121228/44848_1 /TAXON_ID=38298 /ORGANISM="Rhodella maculata, Strain CCMP736" /LENGTH=134 /DNA_ID=CAMNT_0016146039 /DNA_START=245 /DNA_END=649 /DNA_ORIENTATION=-